jgi:hypothetical protein
MCAIVMSPYYARLSRPPSKDLHLDVDVYLDLDVDVDFYHYVLVADTFSRAS